MITVQVAGNEVPLNSIVFPGGEVNVSLGQATYGLGAVIKAQLTSSEEVMKLIFAADALRRLNCKYIELLMPYVPYARQDRVCNVGEAHSLKVFAGLINNLNFDKVRVFDPHSDVTEAVFNNLEIIKNHDFVNRVLFKNFKTISFHLISPDAGASKKIQELGKFLSQHLTFDIIQCGKVRDTATGKLTGFSVDADDLQGMDCVIVDDICSRGGTFLGLAEKLKAKNAGNITLIVSHYEDVANRDAFKAAGITKVICSNSFKDIESCETVTQIKVF